MKRQGRVIKKTLLLTNWSTILEPMSHLKTIRLRFEVVFNRFRAAKLQPLNAQKCTNLNIIFQARRKLLIRPLIRKQVGILRLKIHLWTCTLISSQAQMNSFLSLSWRASTKLCHFKIQVPSIRFPYKFRVIPSRATSNRQMRLRYKEIIRESPSETCFKKRGKVLRLKLMKKGQVV